MRILSPKGTQCHVQLWVFYPQRGHNAMSSCVYFVPRGDTVPCPAAAPSAQTEPAPRLGTAGPPRCEQGPGGRGAPCPSRAVAISPGPRDPSPRANRDHKNNSQPLSSLVFANVCFHSCESAIAAMVTNLDVNYIKTLRIHSKTKVQPAVLAKKD